MRVRFTQRSLLDDENLSARKPCGHPVDEVGDIGGTVGVDAQMFGPLTPAGIQAVVTPSTAAVGVQRWSALHMFHRSISGGLERRASASAGSKAASPNSGRLL